MNPAITNDKYANGKGMNDKDLEFLLSLDKKLHSTNRFTFRPNMAGKTFPVSIDTYTDSSMDEPELKEVFSIIQRGGLVFYPINTALGFSVGFQVADPGTKKALLTFRESQLPERYDFDGISGYFMQQDNIEKALSLGIEIINERSYYDY